MGGDSRLAKAILASRLGANFEHNEFWLTVIRWLVHQPMLDTVQVGPIIDYIYHQKFEPQLASARFGDGELRVQPAKPDFTVQGRTPLSLLAQMRDWRVSLQKATQKPDISWPSSAIAQFELSEGNLASGALRKWTITELLSRRELFQEGQVMRHCVASYDTSCALGGSSIWSMRMERNHGRPKRVLTIEVASHRRVICQIRGKANRLPNPNELDIIRRWALREQLVIDSQFIPRYNP